MKQLANDGRIGHQLPKAPQQQSGQPGQKAAKRHDEDTQQGQIFVKGNENKACDHGCDDADSIAKAGDAVAYTAEQENIS